MGIKQAVWAIVVVSIVGMVALLDFDRSALALAQKELFISLNHHASLLGESFWESATILGDGLALFSLFIPFLFYKPLIYFAFLMTIPYALILTHLPKKLLAVPRPGALLNDESFVAIGKLLKGYNSLPSGHTIAVISAATVITLFLFYYKQNVRYLLPVVAAAALVVAFSRIAVGAHWPLDVAVGIVLGMVAGYLGFVTTLRVSHKYTPGKPGTKAILFHAVFALIVTILLLSKYHHLGLSYVLAAINIVTIAWLLRQRFVTK